MPPQHNPPHITGRNEMFYQQRRLEAIVLPDRAYRRGSCLLLPGLRICQAESARHGSAGGFQGVEYRAPLDVQNLGHVKAIEAVSGRTLWDTRVYHIWILPLVEEDNQWVFINSLEIEDGKLVVGNENGAKYRLNLKTGHVEGAMRYWLPWFLLGIGLLIAALWFWRRAGTALPSTT